MPMFVFLDNEATQGSLNAGSTPMETALAVRTFAISWVPCQLKAWFMKVPTSSNVTDRPSMLDVAELDVEGASRVTVR